MAPGSLSSALTLPRPASSSPPLLHLGLHELQPPLCPPRLEGNSGSPHAFLSGPSTPWSLLVLLAQTTQPAASLWARGRTSLCAPGDTGLGAAVIDMFSS